MSDDGTGRTLAREAAELAALVVGREPPQAVARLRALSRRAAAGQPLDVAELVLVYSVRERYGGELRELEHPEPL